MSQRQQRLAKSTRVTHSKIDRLTMAEEKQDPNARITEFKPIDADQVSNSDDNKICKSPLVPISTVADFGAFLFIWLVGVCARTA